MPLVGCDQLLLVVVLEQEFRIDRFEAQAASNFIVVFFHERAQDNAFSLDLWIQQAHAFR